MAKFSFSRQPIRYRDEIVAIAGAHRFHLTDDYLRLPDRDVHKRMVLLMCQYAADVLRGEVPGPYRHENAERYARACLIPGVELREHLARGDVDVDALAAHYGVPPLQLRLRIAELTGRRGGS